MMYLNAICNFGHKFKDLFNFHRISYKIWTVDMRKECLITVHIDIWNNASQAQLKIDAILNYHIDNESDLFTAHGMQNLNWLNLDVETEK